MWKWLVKNSQLDTCVCEFLRDKITQPKTLPTLALIYTLERKQTKQFFPPELLISFHKVWLIRTVEYKLYISHSELSFKVTTKQILECRDFPFLSAYMYITDNSFLLKKTCHAPSCCSEWVCFPALSYSTYIQEISCYKHHHIWSSAEETEYAGIKFIFDCIWNLIYKMIPLRIHLLKYTNFKYSDSKVHKFVTGFTNGSSEI